MKWLVVGLLALAAIAFALLLGAQSFTRLTLFLLLLPAATPLLVLVLRLREPPDDSGDQALPEVSPGWRRTVLWCAGLLVLVPVASLGLSFLTDLWELLIPLGYLLEGLFLSTMGFLLLVKRRRLGYPPWTLAMGGVALLAALVWFVVPLFLLWVGVTGMAMAGPSDFAVEYVAKIDLRNPEPRVTERYDVQPLNLYRAIAIEEVVNGTVPARDVSSHKVYVERLEEAEVQGVRAEITRTWPDRRQTLGLLRNKVTFRVESLSLRSIEVISIESEERTHHRVRRVEEAVEASDPLSSFREFKSDIEITLPKNSFLASLPAGKVIDLPDRDVAELSFYGHPEDIEIFYLRRARLSMVRDFLRSNSVSDLWVRVLTFLFWPVVLILIAFLREELAKRILSLARKPFARRRRAAGFSRD